MHRAHFTGQGHSGKDSHGHRHGHSHKAGSGLLPNGSFENVHIGLIVAGLTLIFLIWLDSSVIKHDHCDKDPHAGSEHAHARSHEDSSNPAHVQKHGDEDEEEQGPEEAVCRNNRKEREKKGLARKENMTKIRSCCTEGLKYKTSVKQALIFIAVFSIHSIFEGLAFDSTRKNSAFLLTGLVIHKILESVTVGVTLFLSRFSLPVILGLLIFYSSLTPGGILLSGIMMKKLKYALLQEIFNGLSFGSLFFIVVVEMIPPIFHNEKKCGQKIFYLLGGYLLGSLAIAFAHAK